MNMPANIHSLSEAREARMKPQKEDGYTAIANELLEVVARTQFTSREFRVVMAVFRHTYGWNRKQARMTADILGEMTGMHPSRASKVMNALIAKSVIVRNGGSRAPISINKKHWKWEISAPEREIPACAESAHNEPAKSAHDEPTNKDKKDKLLPNGSNTYGSSKPKRAKSKPEYSPEFELAWSEYPKRSGSNPKRAAYQAWNARLGEGVTADEMISGLRRYAKKLTADGSLGTQFVMQGSRFFGPNAEYENPWEPAQHRSKPRSTPGMHTGLSDFSNVQTREDGTVDF